MAHNSYNLILFVIIGSSALSSLFCSQTDGLKKTSRQRRRGYALSRKDEVKDCLRNLSLRIGTSKLLDPAFHMVLLSGF